MIYINRLKEMRDFPDYGCPFMEGGNYYYWFNEGLQNQQVLYTTGSSLDNPKKEFLDPNKFAQDGTASIGTYAFSQYVSLHHMSYIISYVISYHSYITHGT